MFLKKQPPGEEAPFIIHLGQEKLHTNMASQPEPQQSSFGLQHAVERSDKPREYQWATCKKSGRPHVGELRELRVIKNEKIKILRDMGRDWFIAERREGTQGWVHRSWLDFSNQKSRPDAKRAYAQFREDVQKVLETGQTCDFPIMASYIDSCTKPDCQPLKETDSLLGICIHDLMVLLDGSGRYSYEWLKEERNAWHPDRFARFCHPEHADRLKPMAEQMFVLYGVLMDLARS